MAELIAQGPLSEQRWKRPLRDGERFVLGRDAGSWTVSWDDQISRRHAELCWQDGKLLVHRLPTGKNPIFVDGRDASDFFVHVGNHFVIGKTSFTVTVEQPGIEPATRAPMEEQTFDSQVLRRLRFRNADQRIEVLSRLPDVISGAVNDTELFVRLVNMLLAGIPRAGAVAIVEADVSAESAKRVVVLHWDRRLATSGEFRPSERLIREAVLRGQSVLHAWSSQSSGDVSAEFTVMADIDWAFCTPVRGAACKGWAVYVAGRFVQSMGLPSSYDQDDSEATSPNDLREDLKFTELVAATISSLRHVQWLQRTQATLSQFFAPAVLEAMAAADPDVVLAPRETEVSVLFCDLRGFSKQSEKNADNLLGLLHRVSRALGVATHHILDQGGVFGDFQGDAAMGFWGWPLAQVDKVQRACLTALAIRMEFEAAAGQADHPLAAFQMGVGLATGNAVAGRIGTTDQVKVTVFGPLVNRASRLEGMTKILQTPILLDETTARTVREQVPHTVARCRRVAKVRPYGMETDMVVSELLPPESPQSQLSDEDLDLYERALDAFLVGDWTQARTLLHRVPPTDLVKDFLFEFMIRNKNSPPNNWNGVIPMESKS